MIEIKNISKTFHDIKAIDNVSLSISEGNVFGLIGTNGAGKSTFIRILAGVLKPDEGSVALDDMEVYENPEAKKLFFYISDEQFFFPQSTPMDMINFYRKIYPDFNTERCLKYLSSFDLQESRKIYTFSKGMKKQLSFILGICAGTKYLYCDETFDGLDPVMRQSIKSIFAGEMSDRPFTPIIASHNLRELEDICDHVGLLHKGGVLLSKNLGSMKEEIHKIQCVLPEGSNAEEIFSSLEILLSDRRGSLHTLTVRGDKDKTLEYLNSFKPVFVEALPLTLEEIFISETGVKGYDIKKIIL